MMQGAGQAFLVRLLQTAENVAIRTQNFVDRRSSGSACRLYSGLVGALIVMAWIMAAAATADAQSTGAGSQADAVEQKLAVYKQLLTDWAGLTRYGSDNSELGAPRPGEDRVVFFGDDATDLWSGAGFFPGKPYLNRGIRGQNSAQMLVRFRQDVIGLKPTVVVIHAGTNDLARMLGPGTRGTFADNIMSMTELAKAHGIGVVLASLLPVCDCFSEQTSRRSPIRLGDFNEWLQEYAKTSGSVYLDYFTALADGGAFREALTADGVVPNAKGYAAMAPFAEAAIAKALRK
jgi:acyl-CoA thioesterase I